MWGIDKNLKLRYDESVGRIRYIDNSHDPVLNCLNGSLADTSGRRVTLPRNLAIEIGKEQWVEDGGITWFQFDGGTCLWIPDMIPDLNRPTNCAFACLIKNHARSRKQCLVSHAALGETEGTNTQYHFEVGQNQLGMFVEYGMGVNSITQAEAILPSLPCVLGWTRSMWPKKPGVEINLFYVNGKLVTCDTWVDHITKTPTGGEYGHFRVGASCGWPWGHGAFLKADVASVTFYDKALHDTEHNDIYLQALGDFYHPDTPSL